MKTLLTLTILLLSLQPEMVFAEETNSEKVASSAQAAGNSVKKAIRKADDKVCEMFNGKLKCVVKKVKHAVQNAADSISADSNDLKNKADSGK